MLIELALAVSGQRRDGSHVSGAAETLMVNRHGARIRSAITLDPGMDLRVAMLSPYKWRMAKVVWADLGEQQYGLELQQPENFWGVIFPPEDWDRQTPPTLSAAEAAAIRSTKTAAEKVVAPHPVEAGVVRIPKGGAIVTLRGLSSTAVPFQERGLVLPVGESCGSILIGPLVQLGSTLNVIFNQSMVEQSSVVALAHSREYDRWRVWLQFSRRVRAA